MRRKLIGWVGIFGSAPLIIPRAFSTKIEAGLAGTHFAYLYPDPFDLGADTREDLCDAAAPFVANIRFQICALWPRRLVTWCFEVGRARSGAFLIAIGFADGYPREMGNGVGRVSIRGWT